MDLVDAVVNVMPAVVLPVRQVRPIGPKKTWKLLAEYAVARGGDISKMSASDVIYEGGPTVGGFLMTHYLTKCVAPLMKARGIDQVVAADANTKKSRVARPKKSAGGTQVSSEEPLEGLPPSKKRKVCTPKSVIVVDVGEVDKV